MNTYNQPFKKGPLLVMNIKIHTIWRLQFLWMVFKTNTMEKLFQRGNKKSSIPWTKHVSARVLRHTAG